MVKAIGTAPNQIPTNANLGTAAYRDSGEFATAAQGDTADTAYQSSDLASQAQAEAGTDNTTLMTPLRTSQATAAYAYTVTSTSGASQDINFSKNAALLSTIDALTVTYTFSSPASAAKVDLLIDYQSVEDLFNLSSYSYSGASFSVATQELTPSGFRFNSDGTRMYISGASSYKVHEYNLSTAYDATTATFSRSSLSTASQDFTQGLAFSSDGTKFYIVGQTNNTVYQYNMSTAWDVSTASYSGVSFSVAAQNSSMIAMDFSSDGTKMYVSSLNSQRVYQYTLSTAWNPSTATYTGNSFLFGSQDTGPRSFQFNGDGTKLFMTGSTGNKIYRYSLSTAYDITTVTYESDFILTQASAASGVAFSPDGSSFFSVHSTARVIYKYTSTVSPTLVFPTLEGPTIPLVVGEKTALSIFTGDSGSTYQIISAQGGIV